MWQKCLLKNETFNLKPRVHQFAYRYSLYLNLVITTTMISSIVFKNKITKFCFKHNVLTLLETYILFVAHSTFFIVDVHFLSNQRTSLLFLVESIEFFFFFVLYPTYLLHSLRKTMPQFYIDSREIEINQFYVLGKKEILAPRSAITGNVEFKIKKQVKMMTGPKVSFRSKSTRAGVISVGISSVFANECTLPPV